jgi:pyridoxal phosphate enzyme (YggS family)
MQQNLKPETAADTMASRIDEIRSRIAKVCAGIGRDPAEVVLLPVSKTFGEASIREAVALGYHRFGENRTQEIAQKAPLLADCKVQWVVIGQLQTNKAKEVAKYATELQSLDRLELAQALERRLQGEGRSLDVLVQVKTSPEETKAGLKPDELRGFLQQMTRFETLRVKGLMTMAEHTTHPESIRACFRQLRTLRDQLRQELPATVSLDRLSMGMSGDFELAVLEGSTEVRIGSAIFGARPYPLNQ